MYIVSMSRVTSQPYFYLFRYTNDFYFQNIYEFSIPILKMRKPKHKGFKELVQNYTAGSGETDSIISRQISVFLLLNTTTLGYIFVRFSCSVLGQIVNNLGTQG